MPHYKIKDDALDENSPTRLKVAMDLGLIRCWTCAEIGKVYTDDYVAMLLRTAQRFRYRAYDTWDSEAMRASVEKEGRD